MSNRVSSLILSLLSFLLVAPPCSASALNTASPEVEVAFEQDTRLPLVYFNLAAKTGSTSDPKGQEGLTNFMGEMLLRGTKAHTKEQIDLLLDKMGASLDVSVRPEALILRGAVLSSQLEPFLNLIQELITQPSFPDKEIKKLKSLLISVLKEELGHDSSLARRHFNRFLFQGHPYGKAVLGKIADLQKITRPSILAQYRKIFNQANLLAVGYGDSSAEAISARIKAVTKRLPRGTTTSAQGKNPLTKALGEPLSFEHRKFLLIDKPDRTQTQIDIGQIGTKMSDPKFFPLHLGNYALGGPSFSAMLLKEVRVKRGWSYGANSFFQYGTEPRSWQMHLFPAEKDTPAALALTLKIAEDVKANGIPPELFEFSKRSLVNNSRFINNTPRKRVENILLERTLGLPDGFMKTFGPELEKLKLEDVNQALKDFLKPNLFAISVLGTAKSLREPLSKAAGVPEDAIEVISYDQE